MEAKKDWFRPKMLEWVKTIRRIDFDKLNRIDQSKEMTRFYLKEIVAKLTPGSLPDDMDDIDDYIVDGANDGGIDFIYKSENSVLIIQSKYHGPKKSEDESEVTHFYSALQRLYDASCGKRKFNRKVMEAIADIDWENDSYDLRFLTLGKVDQDKFTNHKICVTGLAEIDDRAELSIINETEMNINLREAYTTDKELTKPIQIRFCDSGNNNYYINYVSESGREMYIGVVSGMEFAQLFQHNKYRLFAMNIRDYVGETMTNKGIVNTAQNAPHDFMFFNNGVSAVAAKVIPDDNDESILNCEQFSIINGAQTVRSLFKAYRRKINTLKDVKILFRIVQFRPGKDGVFLTDVTRYNNTQNSIKVSDFRSNDPVQKYLKAQFAKICIGSKPCDYKNKRRQERDSSKFPIGMEELAKAVYSFNYGPDDMYGGTKYLFDLSNKGGYSKVFGDAGVQMAIERFELIAGTYFLCHEIEQQWRACRETDTTSMALERRWLVYFTVGELYRIAYKCVKQDIDEDLRYMSNANKWMKENKENYTKKSISEMLGLAMAAMEQAYKTESNKTDFKHRNWFRNAETLKLIINELSVIPKYRNMPLPLLRRKE